MSISALVILLWGIVLGVFVQVSVFVSPLLVGAKNVTKCSAELIFFVRCTMLLHFSITITQLSAKLSKISASVFA